MLQCPGMRCNHLDLDYAKEKTPSIGAQIEEGLITKMDWNVDMQK